ncbi:protein SIEVE ELEMENT OCCLUSION B-like [Malania oleifera]|uniref:protein SIEVE ELEMENT OCCLUSION B-like n=1 Tax=Malania oleifera TaxID=397392 RepID=UPI0025AEA3F5|nr:protein SIEVE ELEMENT OCCLUSION B-like [Malania oleifera]
MAGGMFTSSGQMQPYSASKANVGGSMFMMSDDNVVTKQIEETHSPDGREVDIRPLLQIVEDILRHSTPAATIGSVVPAHGEIAEEKTPQAGLVTNIPETLSATIDRVACEIACRCMGGTDVHGTTLMVLHLLTNYGWDAKLVLSMAAFALNYGEFWLLAQIYTSNSLAKSMAILKKLPAIMEHSGMLKPRFDSLSNLIAVMLALTKCLVEFKELPSMYISQDLPALVTFKSSLPTAVYWTIRAILVCASQITSLTSLGHEYVTAETWDLSTLTHKINSIHQRLKELLATCYQLIEERRDIEAYELLRKLFAMSHIDNMKVLRALIYAKDDLQPLFDGSTKKRVNIEVLRRKNVLLLISGLDISQDELSILEQIYNESRQHASRFESQYEVVWIPIVDHSVTWTDPMQQHFEDLQTNMPWYTVHHPSMVEKAVIRFVKDVWQFRNKPILVVLDPQARVVSPNALHMMWIWGSSAFPFTSMKEEALWRDETWRLELLVNGIDPTIINWIREGKYIFLYGGDNMGWIRNFTTAARAMAQEARIPLEMVYMGRSGKKEQVRRVAEAVAAEKLSSSWQEPAMIWFFWTRLESMLFSKIQQGKADEHDIVTQEIKKLLSFDKAGGWAVLASGSTVLINGQHGTILGTVVEYDLWKEQVPVVGFNAAITDHHRKLHGAAMPCCRFEFPSIAGRIPEIMKCPECVRLMEKYVTFLCCHDEPALGALYSTN